MQVIAREIQVFVDNLEHLLIKGCVLSDFFRVSMYIGVLEHFSIFTKIISI